MPTPETTPPVEAPKPPTAEELLSLTTPASQPVTETTGKKFRQDFYDGSFVESDDPTEFASKVASRWDAVTQHARKVETENATLRAQTAQVAQAVNVPQVDHNAIATKFWELANQNKVGEAVATALADYLQIGDPNALVQGVQRWESVADRYTAREVVGAFSELAPDFPLGDAGASDVLTAKLKDMGVRDDQLAPPELMLAAHEMCKRENRYQGTTYKAPEPGAAPAGLAPVAATPLPTLSQSAATSPTPDMEDTANRMTAAELRRALEAMVAPK